VQNPTKKKNTCSRKEKILANFSLCGEKEGPRLAYFAKRKIPKEDARPEKEKKPLVIFRGEREAYFISCIRGEKSRHFELKKDA